ncbi:MAG: hypothetical protein RSF33_07995 [Hydrogenoanaerobacterium sp.]
MEKHNKRNTTPRNPKGGVYIRSVTLANDYRLRLPMEIVEQLELDEVATLALRFTAKGKLIIEPWTDDT